MQFPGITQVQINPKAGMTFAAGLRSVLRQDPDVVLVGETRDQETAELSLQASLTGHLVLTTLHTNDAVRAITRIVDMGVEPFLVASSLTLVVAQRLVRRVCPECSAPHRPSAEVLSLLGLTEHELEASSPRVGTGCSNCAGSGYKGRTGIFEVLPITAGLRAVLLDNPTEGALSAVAQAEGVATLRMSALAAARRGITTYEEVLRVTHIDAVDPSSETHCHTCTRQVKADMAFCPWCRAALKRPSCSNCGSRLEPRWQGCAACGTEIGDTDTKPSLAEVLPKSPPFQLPEAPSAPPSAPPSSFLQAGSAAPVAKAEPARPAAFTMPDSFVMPGSPDPSRQELRRPRLLPRRPRQSPVPLLLHRAARPTQRTGTAGPTQRTGRRSPAEPHSDFFTGPPVMAGAPAPARPVATLTPTPTASVLAEALSGLIRPTSPTASATPTQDAPEQAATYTPPASPGGAPGFSTPAASPERVRRLHRGRGLRQARPALGLTRTGRSLWCRRGNRTHRIAHA